MDILLVDDEPIYLTGLKVVLQEVLGARVVAAVSSARAAFAAIDLHPPDVVLLDMGLPGMDGFAAAREIRRRCSRAHILMVSGRRSARDVSEAIKAGAMGFVTKSDAPEALVEAVQKIAAGDSYFGAGLDSASIRLAAMKQPRDAIAALSVREKEVFTLLARGVRNDDIARELCISRKTVDTHRHRIYDKLGCHSVSDLVRFAARNSLLHEPGMARAEDLV